MPWYWCLVIHYPLLMGFQVSPTFQYYKRLRRTHLACVLVSHEARVWEQCTDLGSRLRTHLFHSFLHRQGPLVAQAQEGSSDLEAWFLWRKIMKLRCLEIFWSNSLVWHNKLRAWPRTQISEPPVCSSASARLFFILCDISLPDMFIKLQCLKRLAR